MAKWIVLFVAILLLCGCSAEAPPVQGNYLGAVEASQEYTNAARARQEANSPIYIYGLGAEPMGFIVP